MRTEKWKERQRAKVTETEGPLQPVLRYLSEDGKTGNVQGFGSFVERRSGGESSRDNTGVI